MKITRLEAARRLIHFAIKGYVQEDEPLAVHLAAQSAFRVCRDIVRHRRPEEDALAIVIKPERLSEVLWRITRINNFLKHAERNPEPDFQTDVGRIEDLNEIIILSAVKYYEAASDGHTSDYVMRLFMLLEYKRNPDGFFPSAGRELREYVDSTEEIEIRRLIEHAFEMGDEERARISSIVPGLRF